MLSRDEEAIIGAFRHPLPPPDDCCFARQVTIPHLTRSSLHRSLQRQGVSRLPDRDGGKPAQQSFKRSPIGFFRIAIAAVRTAQGKCSLFVAIDRTGQFACARLEDSATVHAAAAFLKTLTGPTPHESVCKIGTNEPQRFRLDLIHHMPGPNT